MPGRNRPVPCRHCVKRKRTQPRGLCFRCYHTPEVRALYPVGTADPTTAKYAPKVIGGDGEPTEEELNRMIAEQMANLPDWWDKEKPNEDER